MTAVLCVESLGKRGTLVRLSRPPCSRHAINRPRGTVLRLEIQSRFKAVKDTDLDPLSLRGNPSSRCCWVCRKLLTRLRPWLPKEEESRRASLNVVQQQRKPLMHNCRKMISMPGHFALRASITCLQHYTEWLVQGQINPQIARECTGPCCVWTGHGLAMSASQVEQAPWTMTLLYDM